ncbi:MAG: hypothetical protein J6P36_00070 [Lachnospiraceae bacterium]|nr:hypothetical protein [Lachnospiraceae bacterium]
MKRILYPIMIVALVLTCLTACGKKKGNNFNQASPGVTTTSEPKKGSDLYHECGGEVVLGD